jgi:hypothetical protein
MIVELTPENYFAHVHTHGPLHVVMHYGATCGPCKITLPNYSLVEEHFVRHNVTNVKFYWFHHWEPSYRPFIDEFNLKVSGVPSFKYFYMGDLINEESRSFNNPNEIKAHIMNTVSAIHNTIGDFNIYAS